MTNDKSQKKKGVSLIILKKLRICKEREEIIGVFMCEGSEKVKYYNVKEILQQQMECGKIKPGDKIPSENQLSQQFHVSRHTIRKALAILEDEGWIVAEHGRGTFCLDHKRKKKVSKNIAVVTTYLSDYIFPRLIQGIDEVLTKNGYSIILKNTYNSRKNEELALQDIVTKEVDGLIIEPSKSAIFCQHIKQYKMLERLGIPYIFIQGSYPQMKEVASIVMDDVKGAYLLTKYLITLGHKKIAGIFKIDDMQGNNRHKGYVQALNEAGMIYNPDYVILYHTEDRRKKPKLEVKKWIEKNEGIDAIVCYNDQVAWDIMNQLKEMEIHVPSDISITGYDNSIPLEQEGIQLTTIAHPKEQLGQMAAQLILEKINEINDENSKVSRVIEPQIIIGNSCMDRTYR